MQRRSAHIAAQGATLNTNGTTPIAVSQLHWHASPAATGMVPNSNHARRSRKIAARRSRCGATGASETVVDSMSMGLLLNLHVDGCGAILRNREDGERLL